MISSEDTILFPAFKGGIRFQLAPDQTGTNTKYIVLVMNNSSVFHSSLDTYSPDEIIQVNSQLGQQFHEKQATQA